MENQKNTEAASAEENAVDESQLPVNPNEGPLKHMLVDYVGGVYKPEDGNVTVEMVINTIASEFPEFLFVVARENWLRGYQQAMADTSPAEEEQASENS
jgi:hypothetical protein